MAPTRMPNSDWRRVHPVYGVPVAAEQAVQNPMAMFNVYRGDQPHSMGGTVIAHWINTNYFLWVLSERLAHSGVDAEWTAYFDAHHRGHWNEIRYRAVEVTGSARFTLPIPPPPVFEAVVSHTSDPDVTFTVCLEDRPSSLAPPVTSLPEHAVWGLWEFLDSNRQAEIHSFNVVLETWSPGSSSYSCPSSPRQNNGPSCGPPAYSDLEDAPPPYSG